MSSQLSALRSAFTDLSVNGTSESHESTLNSPKDGVRIRALANWDPAYPGEQPDYYLDYIHRHAPINVGGLQTPTSSGQRQAEEFREATGVGLLIDAQFGAPQHAIAPLEDGSVCIWNIRARETGASPSQGVLVGQSPVGLLSSADGSNHTLDRIKAIMTETGAVESTSIDSWNRRGYFAQNNALVEVDLATLQVVSREEYPFPISALSEAYQNRLMVGTNNTVHMYDPRNKNRSPVDPALTVEVIGGPTASHITLSQPGPLSILNRFEDDSIWIAGRFTHLLNYDRRFFPRLRGTVHSGARISCIATLPYPLIPRSMDLLQEPSVAMHDLYAAKSKTGGTLLAAGEYKGKGSLEYYNLSSALSGPRSTNFYQNRQTASSNKLLAVASHGLATVYSDGDGNLKWVERDGSTPIRTHNINGYSESPSFNQLQSAAQNQTDLARGDIVQKIIPLDHRSIASSSSSSSRIDNNQSDLLLKSGDGRLSIVSFGHESLIAKEDVDAKVESIEEMCKRDAEKSYTESMGRLLKRHADEAIWLSRAGFGI